MRHGHERVCVFIICSSVENNWIFEIGEVGSQRAPRGRGVGGVENGGGEITPSIGHRLNMSISKSYTVSHLTVLLP